MSLSRTHKTLTLSLSLLLASTSLASAGFVWLSPDQPSPNPEAVYTPQQEAPTADGAQSEGREWAVTEPAPETAAAPVGLTLASGEGAQPQPAPGATAILKNETVIGSPVYSRGDQKHDDHVSAPVPTAPVAPLAPAPAAAQEVTLGRMHAAETSEPAPPAPLAGSQPVELAPATALAPEMSPPPPSGAPSAISLVTGEEVPLASPPKPAASAPSMANAKVVDGFGKHVPLIIALRQILPADYGFAHRDGVDLSQSVDWQGGRPWPQVLKQAIAPLGLTATITLDTVLLEKSSGAAPSDPSPALAPAPAPAPASAPALAPELTPPSSSASSGVVPQLTNATMMQAPLSDR